MACREGATVSDLSLFWKLFKNLYISSQVVFVSQIIWSEKFDMQCGWLSKLQGKRRLSWKSTLSNSKTYELALASPDKIPNGSHNVLKFEGNKEITSARSWQPWEYKLLLWLVKTGGSLSVTLRLLQQFLFTVARKDRQLVLIVWIELFQWSY